MRTVYIIFNSKITVSIGGVPSGPIKLMVLAGLLAKSMLGIAVLVPGGKFIVTSPRMLFLSIAVNTFSIFTISLPGGHVIEQTSSPGTTTHVQGFIMAGAGHCAYHFHLTPSTRNEVRLRRIGNSGGGFVSLGLFVHCLISIEVKALKSFKKLKSRLFKSNCLIVSLVADVVDEEKAPG